MDNWHNYLHNSITNPEKLEKELGCKLPEIKKISRTYPLRITPYYLDLIKKHGSPLYKQAIPDMAELHDNQGIEDPLDEDNLSPVAGLVHKYSDRVLFLISNQCAMYCRFCTRKRRVGKKATINNKTIRQGIEYIKKNPAIKDVLVSGGDPLMLSDNRVESIIKRIREIKSVEIIRIGTRTPCTLPMRITPELVNILKKYQPIYVNTHFNHPAEITMEATIACNRLTDAGIPVGCQTVLLKGVNDDKETIKELMRKLIRIRVKPYYLFQMDLTRGTSHFRTRIETGLEIMHSLIGHVSGMAIPTFAIDAPDGKGKVYLSPEYIKKTDCHTVEFYNHKRELCYYPND